MNGPRPSHHGVRLLDRRGFLTRTFDGLGGIAMAAMLRKTVCSRPRLNSRTGPRSTRLGPTRPGRHTFSPRPRTLS